VHGRLGCDLPFLRVGAVVRVARGPPSPARDFWTELAAAIGYSGLAARFRYVTEPWGEDVLYHFHRQISLVAVGLIVAHTAIMLTARPDLFASCAWPPATS
jgi:hypothetical protein